jgi:glycosyltransferase involved in cell wall biosynthesis
METVDVVVPCYQYGRFLRECVRSVLTQDLPVSRVLIIDNGSSDDSVEVANQLAAEDCRVEVIAHPRNRGATYSFNEGIEWATSKYFLILDADDLLAPGALGRAVSIMESREEISFTCGVELRLPDGRSLPNLLPVNEAEWNIVTGRDFIKRLCRTPVNVVGANTTIRRTSAQKAVGYYNEALPYTDDLEMWLRLATVGSVATTSSIQAIRRLHPLRMSAAYDGVDLRDFVEREAAFTSFLMSDRAEEFDRLALTSQVRRGLSQHAYWSAISHLYRFQPRAAANLFRYSFHRHPLGTIFPPIGWLLRMDRPIKRAYEILFQS